MAAQSAAEQALRNLDIQYGHLLPQMQLRDAVRLMIALGQFCESPAPPNWDLAQGPLPAHLIGRENPLDRQGVPWSNNLHRAQVIDPSAQFPLPCWRPPVWINPATGQTELSYCIEPRNQAFGGMHPPGGRNPLACIPCKTRRGEDFDWKQNRLKLGVCKSCRIFITTRPANQGGMAAAQDDCVCPPHGSYNGNVNNGERRKMHLCFDHFDSHWTGPMGMRGISHDAAVEIDWRAWCIRTRAPPRRGHGWARRVQRGPRPVRTPLQRRLATRDPRPVNGGLPLQPAWGAPGGGIPRCYCGNRLTALDHAWNPPMVLNADQVRNCAACQRFWRTR